ncbi:hypothetical protein A4G26_20740 [Mycobacterium kansasii]|uniref:DUF7159 domain-containing protein n=2 Tax=Mycobacterium innocens TaxID=2341083 RepID=A0A498PRA3_9MYCO|nr:MULTISPECIES: hypothetical protein [Mycobacterium]KZS77685.1 hypothetical protein A4G26_20740 [Mycobacterium kansasii]VBA33749.1 hypothetical protein LAUMK13_00339 [Mycobacterium innocens]
MAPTAVRMVLVEGENGDGALVEQDEFDVSGDGDAATVSAAQQVVSAILGTREGASEGGYQLASIGVTWRDPAQAAALREALANQKIEKVVLVSAFLAAAALAQAVGNETNYAHTALLFVEPETATLAVVDSADGSIADIQRQLLSDDDDTAVAQLTELVSAAESLETHPDAIFVVGSDIDIPMIKPALETATALPVTAAEEPDTALARGAALASANTPLFVSSTAALAYAQDPGTGALDPYRLDAAYFNDVSDSVQTGEGPLAYSAVPDSVVPDSGVPDDQPERKPFPLLASIVTSIFVIGVAALALSLAVSIRSSTDVKPDPGHNVVTPSAPASAAQAPAPTPQAPAPTPQAPAPAPAPQAPAPAPQEPAPAPQAPAPAPRAPAPAPRAPAPAPAPVPEAPAPAPAPVPAAPAPAPVPIPVPVQIPVPIFGPPGGGFPGGGGHGDDDHGGGRGGGHGGGHGHGRGGFNIPFVPGL